MAEAVTRNITKTNLPADLPTDWSLNQTISPGGTEVGLTKQHGYNYLMEQVNKSQQAINTMSAQGAELSQDVTELEKFKDARTVDANYQFTLTVANWVAATTFAFKQEIADVRILSNVTKQIITINPNGVTNLKRWMDAGVVAEQAAGKLVFYCSRKPTQDIIGYYIIEGSGL